MSGDDVPRFELVPEFGVILLKHVLSTSEQLALYKQVKDEVKTGQRGVPGNFHLSSGAAGSSHRRDALHELGNLLFHRAATAAASIKEDVSGEDATTMEPSLNRLQQVLSGERPADVQYVAGVAYTSTAKLANHCDMNKPLYTMSLALGEACDFTFGEKTARPYPNERSGKPVSLRMESGDAMFFDGGSIPHAVDGLVAGSAPDWWAKAGPKCSRVSFLFREA
ncbi:unnamed protein product [Symbiodinium sp. CCMP2592]|nr:unnamed protein product [Symbiodinium sp. CCMP2592]